MYVCKHTVGVCIFLEKSSMLVCLYDWMYLNICIYVSIILFIDKITYMFVVCDIYVSMSVSFFFVM